MLPPSRAPYSMATGQPNTASMVFLKVEQRLGRREHGVHPPRRSPALTLQKLREEIDRAGVAVEAQGPVLRDDPRVHGQRGLAEVECRDQPRVDEPVPQVAKAVLPRRLDR